VLGEPQRRRQGAGAEADTVADELGHELDHAEYRRGSRAPSRVTTS
jgi:hypothetical protein